jgi:proteasome lid subunit RPN8/RPN11
MNPSRQLPLIPIYLKLDDAADWPPDKTFYVLSRDGLFLCRNHEFFSSCVRADRWPGELAGQQPFLKMSYPRLSRRMIEQVVGFFDIIASYYDSEAAVLLLWNRDTRQVELVVPKQTGTVGTSYYGSRYPLDLAYEIPPLPKHQMLIGDIHSHVDGPAYASWTDKADESYRPGLHLVVGRIQQEPPEFYCAVTADGGRFEVKDLALVMESYQERRRSEVPEEWIDQVSVEGCSISKHYVSSLKERKAAPGMPAPPAGDDLPATRREEPDRAAAKAVAGLLTPGTLDKAE